MPFKLIKILNTFQSYINKISIKKLDVFIIIYLNNILIYTKNKRKKYVKAV